MKVTEGQRRLRILGTVFTSTVAGMFLATQDYVFGSNMQSYTRVILWTAMSGAMYVFCSAAYWVWEGFEKPRAQGKNISPAEMVAFSKDCATRMQAALEIFGGRAEKGLSPIEDLMSDIKRSWSRPILAYSFGLTWITVAMVESRSIKEPKFRRAANLIQKELIALSHKDLVLLSLPRSFNPERDNKLAAVEVTRIAKSVAFFVVTMTKKGENPLGELNHYLSEQIGVPEDLIKDTGMECLKILQSKIAP